MRTTLKDKIYNIYLGIRFKILSGLGLDKRESSENKRGLNLTFSEYFNDISWDYNGYDKWKIGEVFGLYHPEKNNVYYGPPSIKTIDDKKYGVFTVKYNPKSFDDLKIPFEVSLLSSQRSFKQQYGRFECRMNLPTEKGVWPAFWLWGSPWPPEIDVIESYGKENGLTSNIQKCNIWSRKNNKATNIGSKPIKLKDTDFQEFAVEWRKGSIKFYTNGILVCQYTNKKELDVLYNRKDTGMWVVINHSIQEKYVSRYETDYYSEFLVDYIRCYQ